MLKIVDKYKVAYKIIETDGPRHVAAIVRGVRRRIDLQLLMSRCDEDTARKLGIFVSSSKEDTEKLLAVQHLADRVRKLYAANEKMKKERERINNAIKSNEQKLKKIEMLVNGCR